MNFASYITSKPYWSFAEAINIVATLAMKNRIWNTGDDYLMIFNNIAARTREAIVVGVSDRPVLGKIVRYELEEPDPYGVVDDIDYGASTVRSDAVLRWAVAQAQFFKAEIIHPGQDPKEVANAKEYDDEIVGTKEADDLKGEKYPDFKGLKFDELTNEQFTDLKKHYGMLKLEESKWRRAVQIAARIGLLFHGQGLKSPITRTAFLAAYKNEFDALLKNNTVANYIYDHLPEEYRAGSGTPESSNDLAPVIKAAAFAGSMAHARDNMTLKALKRSLRLESYTIPSDEILEAIIGAVKNLEVDVDD